MTMTIARKAFHGWGLLLAAAALLGAATATADDAPPNADPPAGQLLIASAAMQDPRFYHSVILLLRHDQSGAFGVVINHPLTEEPLAKLLDDAGAKGGGKPDDGSVEGTIPVFLGGPVQPQYGFIVHSTDYSRPENPRLDEAFAVTAGQGGL